MVLHSPVALAVSKTDLRQLSIPQKFLDCAAPRNRRGSGALCYMWPLPTDSQLNFKMPTAAADLLLEFLYETQESIVAFILRCFILCDTLIHRQNYDLSPCSVPGCCADLTDRQYSRLQLEAIRRRQHSSSNMLLSRPTRHLGLWLLSRPGARLGLHPLPRPLHDSVNLEFHRPSRHQHPRNPHLGFVEFLHADSGRTVASRAQPGPLSLALARYRGALYSKFRSSLAVQALVVDYIPGFIRPVPLLVQQRDLPCPIGQFNLQRDMGRTTLRGGRALLPPRG